MKSILTGGKVPELSKKNWIQLVAMTVIFVIAAFLVYKTTITVRMVMPRITVRIKGDEDCYYTLTEGERLEQKFVYPSDELLCVGTKVSLDELELKDLVVNKDERDLGILHVTVLDDAGNSLMQGNYDVYLLEDGQNLLASFRGRQTGWEGRELTLVMEAENLSEKVELKFGYTEKEIKGAALSADGEVLDGNLNIVTAGHQFLYWKQWFVAGMALMYLLLAGT